MSTLTAVLAEPFADRLEDAIDAKSSPLCVGIDPRLDKIPADVRAAAGGDAAKAYLRFGLEILDLVAPHAACVKPNLAFFEALGLAGMSAYAGVVRGARSRGLLVIGDAKRGDLSTTAEAYAQAHLAPGGDFEADALTVAPYLGADSLAPFVDAAAKAMKGLYVLVRTSNPGAGDLQDLVVRDAAGAATAGERLYERTAAIVRRLGEAHRGRRGLSLVGAVVGATWPAQAAALRAALPATPFLVPGYGAQGATAADVAASFLSRGPAGAGPLGALGAIVNASRSITFPATKDPAEPWRGAVEAAARKAKEELHAARLRAV